MGDFLDEWRGPFTLEQARAQGFDLKDVRRMVRAGYIKRLRARVYVAAAELAAAEGDAALLHAL
ncbi:MAG TPA: type IV toxin-antitoxin system AbiEi family antitoxin domain-containing protein, partial [Sporichthya sp.]|nr:type IV toxin-antitoxin system AbiEi family antitoxin domain-containing protein [Sporichthya sp.]